MGLAPTVFGAVMQHVRRNGDRWHKALTSRACDIWGYSADPKDAEAQGLGMVPQVKRSRGGGDGGGGGGGSYARLVQRLNDTVRDEWDKHHWHLPPVTLTRTQRARPTHKLLDMTWSNEMALEQFVLERSPGAPCSLMEVPLFDAGALYDGSMPRYPENRDLVGVIDAAVSTEYLRTGKTKAPLVRQYVLGRWRRAMDVVWENVFADELSDEEGEGAVGDIGA
jgi:hypothetical protein